MVSTSARVLRLLSLLQSRRDWSGRELGERLEVDVRTLRRDMDRLRSLGYVIDSSAGVGGGYRLGHGTTTPPLLLDDDEAVTVAVALAASAGSTTANDEVAIGVLAKLNQVMPPRLSRKLGAISASTLTLPDGRPRVDFRLVATLAGACRDQLVTRFSYQDAKGAPSRRTVEPLRLVHARLRFYLVARDVDRDDFRTFRVDRIGPREVEVLPRRFVRREPEGGIAAYMQRSLAYASARLSARLLVLGSAEELAARVPSWIGRLEACSARRAVLTISAESEAMLVGFILMADVPFQLLDPPALRPALEAAAARLHAGSRPAPGPRSRCAPPPRPDARHPVSSR